LICELCFSDSGDYAQLNKDARRKIAAPQPVILKERPLLPRMKDLDRRSPLCSPLPVSLSQAPPYPAFFQLLLKTNAEPEIDPCVPHA
jgi:hypothetical protein